MENKNIIIIGAIVIVVALGIYGLVNWSSSSSGSGEYDSFAKCLSEEGIKMYGTDWCPHCKKQKEMFEGSFEHVDYVNCEFEKGKCNAAGVQGYPTWEIDGERYSGTQSLSKLSRLSGCSIYEEENETRGN